MLVFAAMRSRRVIMESVFFASVLFILDNKVLVGWEMMVVMILVMILEDREMEMFLEFVYFLGDLFMDS